MVHMAEEKKSGVIVIHGLTGTPATMETVSDKLEKEGFLVVSPLLPGHGTTPEELSLINQEEWISAILSAYESLLKKVEEINLVGLSLGALLALKLALLRPEKIFSIVTIGTPLVLPFDMEWLAYPLVKFTPVGWIYKYSKKSWEKSVADEAGRAFYARHSYDKIPTHSVLELFKLKKELMEDIQNIKAPVLAIHGSQDAVAPLKNVDILMSRLKSRIVEKLILKNSRHVVTLDYDKMIAADATAVFIKRFSRASGIKRGAV